jgi:hypothetical protein
MRASYPLAAESNPALQQLIVSQALAYAGGKQRDDICLLTAKLV